MASPVHIPSSPPLPNMMEIIDLVSSDGDNVDSIVPLLSDVSIQEPSSDPVIDFNRGGRKRPRVTALIPSDPISSSQEPLKDLVTRTSKRLRRASLGTSTVDSDPDHVVEEDDAGHPVALPAPATGPRLVDRDGSGSLALAPAATPILVSSTQVTRKDVEIFVGRSFGRVPPEPSRNQNLFHNIVALTDRHLKFDGQPAVGAFGHCCYLQTRTVGGPPVVKLKEAGTNNDAPRTELLGGLKKGTKVYIYHILARHKAELRPGGTLTMERLRAVSMDKRDSSPVTIVHLCGHKWCMNEDHLDIKSKRYNDEQYSCHRGLQSVGGQQEFLQVQNSYCKHAVKCWTILYKGVFADEHQWAPD